MASIGEHQQEIRNLMSASSQITERVRTEMRLHGPLGMSRTILAQLVHTIPDVPDPEKFTSMSLNQLQFVRQQLGAAAAATSELVGRSDECQSEFVRLRGEPGDPHNTADQRYLNARTSLGKRHGALEHTVETASRAMAELGDEGSLPDRAGCQSSLELIEEAEAGYVDAVAAGTVIDNDLGAFLER